MHSIPNGDRKGVTRSLRPAKGMMTFENQITGRLRSRLGMTFPLAEPRP